jgi:hypothetical protein
VDSCVAGWSDKPISRSPSSSAGIALLEPSAEGTLSILSDRETDARSLNDIECSRSLAVSLTEEYFADASSYLVASTKADVRSVDVEKGSVSNVLSFRLGYIVFFYLESSIFRLSLI